MSDFEMQMLYHGAPTLYGIKQANLFSLPLTLLPDLQQEVALYQSKLEKKGISLEYLYCCCKRVFFLVYRKDALLAYFAESRVKTFLQQEGYPEHVDAADTLRQTLAHLRQRIHLQKDFPHEIGFFLGYPAEDVFAFMQERGQNYKLCGYWKVYGDEKNALATFQRYTRCRNTLLNYASQGIPILTLLEAQ